MADVISVLTRYAERKADQKYTGCIKIGYENTRITNISEVTFSEFVPVEIKDDISSVVNVIKDCIVPESVGTVIIKMNRGHYEGISYSKGFRGRAAYEYIAGNE